MILECRHLLLGNEKSLQNKNIYKCLTDFGRNFSLRKLRIESRWKLSREKIKECLDFNLPDRSCHTCRCRIISSCVGLSLWPSPPDNDLDSREDLGCEILLLGNGSLSISATVGPLGCCISYSLDNICPLSSVDLNPSLSLTEIKVLIINIWVSL